MEVMPDKKHEVIEVGGALAQVNSELRAYWPPLAFVARGVSFDMQLVINRARKNYFGIFEEPKDPITKQDKTFVPLSEATVETIVKDSDIDTKDIQLFPKKQEDLLGTKILRQLVQWILEKIEMGQLLNDLIRTMVIDGTVVLKTYKGFSKDFKKKVTKVKIVDLLNFYIDPAADSIQEAESVIERVIMYPDELEKFKKEGWKNTEGITTNYSTNKTPDTYVFGQSNLPNIVVFERWGKIKESWLHEFEGKEHKGEDHWIEGVVIGSGQGTSITATKLHFVGENKKGMKPYEEGWYRRMRNRWHGRGPVEQLFMLQEYVNAIFNIRKNNAFILQNGIFLVRKGSGITPQMISSIAAGGTIPVTGLDTDIKQLPVQDVRQSSYKDEEVATNWARGVSMGFLNPATVAPSAPATLGIISQQQTRDVFDLIREGLGFLIERLLQNHAIPSFLEDLESDEIIRIVGSRKDLEDLDEIYVEMKANAAAIKYLDKEGFWPEETEIETEKEKLRNELKKLGSARFIEYKKSFFDFEYDVKFEVTSEGLDKAVLVQQLRDMVVSYARVPGVNIDVETVFQEWMNVLGIRADLYKKRELPPQQQQLQSPRLNQELPEGVPNLQTVNAVANRLPAVGIQGR